jgi:hypothetical protein
MSHILMLTPQIPFPPRQGTRCELGAAARLAAHHTVSLLTFAAPDQEPTAPAAIQDSVARVAVFPQPTRTLVQRLTQLLTDPRPDLLLRLESQPFRETLRAGWMPLPSIGAGKVGVDGLSGEVWDRTRRPRVTFDDHNCEYFCNSAPAAPTRAAQRAGIGAAYSAVQWRRLRRHEADVCRRADLVVTFPTPTPTLCATSPPLEAPVVPTAFTSLISRRSRAGRPAPTGLRLHRHDEFSPQRGRCAVVRRKVWPQVRSVLPDAHFYIVGRQPHARLEPLRALPGIVITAPCPPPAPTSRRRGLRRAAARGRRDAP